MLVTGFYYSYPVAHMANHKWIAVIPVHYVLLSSLFVMEWWRMRTEKLVDRQRASSCFVVWVAMCAVAYSEFDVIAVKETPCSAVAHHASRPLAEIMNFGIYCK